jgi:hypothetical protein
MVVIDVNTLMLFDKAEEGSLPLSYIFWATIGGSESSPEYQWNWLNLACIGQDMLCCQILMIVHLLNDASGNICPARTEELLGISREYKMFLSPP